MSAGTANPTTWPRCRFPDAYGQAGATKILRGCFCSDKGRLRLGDAHDTSSLASPSAPQNEREREQQSKRDREQRPGDATGVCGPGGKTCVRGRHIVRYMK